MVEHGFDRRISISDVLLAEFVEVLVVDSRGDGFDGNGVDDELEVLLRPPEFLVLLQDDEVPAFRCIRDGWIEECRFWEAVAVEVGVARRHPHFLLVEDEREVAVAPALFCGVEVRRKRGELLDEFAYGGESRLANNGVQRNGRHAAADHFPDGGDGGRVGGHRRA